MKKVVFIILNVLFLTYVNGFIEYQLPSNNAFDLDLYENVLDEQLCTDQLNYIVNYNTMLRAECKYIYSVIRLKKDSERLQINTKKLRGPLSTSRIHSYMVLHQGFLIWHPTIFTTSTVNLAGGLSLF